MVDLRDEPRFALEAGETIGIVGERRREDLDGDISSQAGVARTIHLAHGAVTQQTDNLICPEPVAGLAPSLGTIVTADHAMCRQRRCGADQHQRNARILAACASVKVSDPLAASRTSALSHSACITPGGRMRIPGQEQVTDFVRDDVRQHRAEVDVISACEVLHLPEEHLRREPFASAQRHAHHGRRRPGVAEDVRTICTVNRGAVSVQRTVKSGIGENSRHFILGLFQDMRGNLSIVPHLQVEWSEDARFRQHQLC